MECDKQSGLHIFLDISRPSSHTKVINVAETSNGKINKSWTLDPIKSHLTKLTTECSLLGGFESNQVPQPWNFMPLYLIQT